MALWTPADLATAPVDWFKADSGVTQTSNNVTSWTNNGSRGTALTNSSGSNRPVYNSANSSFFNLPTIEASSAGQKLNMSGQTFPTEWTIDTEHVYDADNHTALLSVRNGALPAFPTNIMLGAVWPATTVDTNSPKTTYYNAVLQTDVGSEGGASAGTAGWYMWVGRIKGTALGGTVYGRIVAPDGYMFNRSGGDRTGNITVAEFLSGTGTLSSTDREYIEGYLSWKWAGDGSFLPVGHPYKSAAPTSGTSVALTGQSLALSRGLLGVSVARALAGQALTAAQGSAGVNVSRALSGQALTAAQGSAGVNVSRALSGQVLALAQGSPAVSASVALAGQSATFGQGNLTASSSSSTSVALTGQSLSVSRGAIGVQAAVALVGQAAALQQSSLSPAISRALTGQALTTALGSLGKTFSITPAGQALGLAQGALAPSATGQSVSVALSGQQLATFLGTFTLARRARRVINVDWG
jgi:hypothetical protein